MENRGHRIKKRFIFMGIVALIFAMFAIDRVSNNFFKQKDLESQLEYEKFIKEADSALMQLDETERFIHELAMKDSADLIKIDSLKQTLAENDRLSKSEKMELLNRISEIELRNKIKVSDNVVIKIKERIKVYDTTYVDTTIYRYNYIDSVIYVMDTVVRVDTLLIEDQKSVNKIRRRYGK